ncbi:MAG: ATP phosphoribosyltransferase regulatory subunit [Nevskiales bacterium]
MRVDRWLLPEGVDEALPDVAWRLERARAKLLGVYRAWGYELIRPPFIEYLDSLLTGAGSALDLQTFKFADQLSGRMLGIRSDITTQAARIDAHRLRREGAARYCYIGSVLRTVPDGLGGTRAPLQVGAELFGHAGVASDFEVLALMLETLTALGIAEVHLDLGHVGIYRALSAKLGLGADVEQELFDILQRKSRPDLAAFMAARPRDAQLSEWLNALILLNGDLSVLPRARQQLAAAGAEVTQALDTLEALVKRLRERYPAVPIHIDLAELRGYRYKTGVVFAAFVSGQGRELARGGRYDGVGAAFGRARAATGFSADLNQLITLAQLPEEGVAAPVFAPAVEDAALAAKIAELRGQGRRVVQALGQETAASLACQDELVKDGKDWKLRSVKA